jgi:methionyl aminopeptidase
MIKLKTEKDIEILRQGGKNHSFILKELSGMVKVGVSTLDLENRARELISNFGDKGAFFGYKPSGAKRPANVLLNKIIHRSLI